MITVRHLYRHPIKALGWEALERAEITAGESFPGDRRWGVAHEAAKLVEGWNRHQNFIRGASSGALMAISLRTEGDGRLTLTHPERPAITLDPEVDSAALVDWVRPLCDPDRAAPARVFRASAQGLTDNPRPYHSLLNLASLRALEGRVGFPLDARRFRGNIWVEGDGPWQEFEWVGQTITIGGVRYRVEDRIDRCRAPNFDPQTARENTDILATLEAGWGHPDFGVFAMPETSGVIALGDPLTT